MSDQPPRSWDAFWHKIYTDLKRESDRGEGPWILTPAGRSWATKRKDDTRMRDKITTAPLAVPSNPNYLAPRAQEVMLALDKLAHGGARETWAVQALIALGLAEPYDGHARLTPAGVVAHRSLVNRWGVREQND